MTRIRFYTDIPDKIGFVHELLGQALAKQRQVTLYVGSQDQARTVSDRLWQHQRSDFLPNVFADDRYAKLTPIQIAWQPEQIVQDDLLFHCEQSLPKFFSRFRHMIELIGTTDEEKSAGRQRYAFYRDRGYEIQHIKMTSSLQGSL